jgi:hypothetical protein
MSDNVYKVLLGDDAPFGGLANKNCNDRIIKGFITQVHYELFQVSEGKPILQQNYYRSVDVQWLEGKLYESQYVRIPETVSFKGYGLNYLPSIGDTVYAAFDTNNEPVIISIVARCSVFEHGALNNKTLLPDLNDYGDPILDDVIPDDIKPTPIRYIVPGEISLKSLKEAELFLDDYGSIKQIVRKQNNEQKYGDRLWEISAGENIIDEHTGETKKSSFGNNIQYQILGHQNNTHIDADEKGNLEINNDKCDIQIDKDGVITVKIKNGEQIKITSDGIFLGNITMQQAVLGNTLQMLLIELINAYNSHTHTGNLGFPTDSPKTTVIMQDILSKTVELK